jgi:WD40 repeat protein
VPIERRDLLTEEVINTQHEDIYHEKAGQAVDVLDFGYLQAPIVTQSVNETMEMYEQSTAHAGAAGYISTGGVHHQSSHRDLAMDSLFYSQNATDYELSNVTCVTMTPNGKYAIIGQSLGSPQIWDTTNGQLIRSMNGACSNCSNLTLACNGTLLAGLASDANGVLDGHALNLQLWEVQTGRPIQLTHQIKCCVFALSSDSNSIFMAGIALDAEPKCIQVLNNNEVLTGTRGGHIVQWNIHSCKPTVTFVDPNENRAHNANVHQILLSPDKEYLASGSSDGTAKVWNTNSKQLVSIMNGHQGEVRK